MFQPVTGAPVRAEQPQELLRAMNKQKLAHSEPEERRETE